MQTKIISAIAIFVTLLVLSAPLAFATTSNGVTITKVITCSDTSPDSLYTVPSGTYEQWGVLITVQNGNNLPITNVRVSDRFGGEFGVTDPPMAISQGTVQYSYSGATNKVSIFWDVGTIAAHSSVSLWLKVYTDVNPGGQQEFTSCGPHTMNSGAVAKWLDANGRQQSVAADPIVITVIPPP